MDNKQVARELVKLAKVLTGNSNLKEKWLDLAEDLMNTVSIHARKQGKKKVLSRVDKIYKELREMINELD